MQHATPPLFGSDWTDDQIERFELLKDETLGVGLSAYTEAEATLALMTLKVLNAMIPDQAPQNRPALIRIQELAIDIVCRRLLGVEFRNAPPILHRGENSPPFPMSPDRVLFIDHVKYWMDHERRKLAGNINSNQLRRLEEALQIAQADRAAISRARRSRIR